MIRGAESELAARADSLLHWRQLYPCLHTYHVQDYEAASFIFTSL